MQPNYSETILFTISFVFVFPEGLEYEYSGSEDEDDEVTEEEGEPRWLYSYVSKPTVTIYSFNIYGAKLGPIRFETQINQLGKKY